MQKENPMTPTLYFLRSSESKIVQDMTKYAHKPAENLKVYYEFYGLKATDLGLYALVDNKIAGAVWSRTLSGFQMPRVSICVLPAFRNSGVATAMMEQFLQEAAVVSTALEIESYEEAPLVALLQKFDFRQKKESSCYTLALQKKEIQRPSDGYDPRRWMD